MEVIGKEIVEKCDSLPLAAKRLGVLLRTRVEEHEWRDILNKKIWDLPDEERDGTVPFKLRIITVEGWNCIKLRLRPKYFSCCQWQTVALFHNEGNNKNAASHLLEYFVIEGCSSLKCLPGGKLPITLKTLENQNCMNLESLPENMTSVQFLNISECCSIVSFPRGGLHTVPSSNFMMLKQLTINKCF